METAIKKTSHKELIKLIAESSRYHKYEIEDILNHMIGHVQVILGRGETVKIDGIGTLKPTKYLLSTQDGFSGNPTKMLYNAVKISVKIDPEMKRNLEGIKHATADTSKMALSNGE